MKILRLEILNLASLDKQGGEIIDFVTGALGDSTIFSIVGPTGSGKSTLLDAICLALYNRAPRYPRKKGDRNQNIEVYGTPDDAEANRPAPTDACNILTHGKKEGYSKLTFQANNGQVYRAEWYVRFKTKRFEKPTTCLYRIFSDAKGIMHEETAEWDDLPTIIGLDYEQFLRTVLIAQGSFANFLNAKEDERYELLEKLIGCEELYSRIASEIKVKRDAAAEVYNQVNASIEAVRQNLLSDEERENLENEIKQLEAKEKEISDSIKAIETQLQWYADDDKMVSDIEQQQAAADKARQELDDFQPAIFKLHLHDDIAPAVNCLRDIKTTKADIEDTNSKIKADELIIKQQDEHITAAKHLLSQLEAAAEKAQSAIDETAPHIQKARELGAKIDTAANVLKDKQNAKTLAVKDFNDAQKAVADNNAETQKARIKADQATGKQKATEAEVEKKKKELKDAAEKAEEALEKEMLKVAGVNAEDLQEQKAQANDDWLHLKKALEVTSHLNRAQAEKEEKDGLKTRLEEKNALLSEQLAKLDIDSLKKETETLRKTYTLMTSEQWSQHRATLTEGMPCPLCGATEHPYQADEKVLDETTSELLTLLQSKEATLQEQEKNKTEWNGEKNKNEGEISGLRQRLQQLNSDIAHYENEWQALLEWNPQLKKDEALLDELLPSYEKRKDETDEKLTAYNKVQKTISQLTKRRDEALGKQTTYTEEAAGLLSKAQKLVNDSTTLLAQAEALGPTLLHQLEGKRKTLNDATAMYKQAYDALKDLQDAYKAELGEQHPDAVEQRLKKNKEDATDAVKCKKEEISKMQAELARIYGGLQNQKDLLGKQQQTLDRKDKELADWMDHYNGKDDQVKVVTMDDVEAMYLATDDWNAIRQEKDRRNENAVSTSALLKKAKDNHAKHQEQKPMKTRESLRSELQELQDHSHNEQLIADKARMANHIDAIARLGDKVTALNQATRVKEDWTAITDAIGGEGKTLRKIAQCYTLGFLVEHANAEIRKFNSRYELVQVKNSLGIRVIDHDRADDVRDTTSLSGGETFIVSLGLALGLSSLSSRNISFENLFIDEGFGTLDPDMLATVIDSLAMLQSSQGKKVGVISHTDTMSERITTQIRIVKNGHSGSSHIEIYP